jgi:hypothetical protein
MVRFSLIVAMLLAAAVPHAAIVCPCRDIVIQPPENHGGCCGDLCTMDPAENDSAHPADCGCNDCQHVELTDDDGTLFTPQVFRLNYRPDGQWISVFPISDNNTSVELNQISPLDSANRFTTPISRLLSTTILLC